MAVFLVADSKSQSSAPSSCHALAPSTILTRLRLETRGEHDAVERVLDLMGAGLTRETYCQRLVQFYGFYGPLEAALRARCATPYLQTLASRLNKTSLLRQDLHYLSVSTDALALCRDLPPIDDQTEILGCLYVMEGATLGGRMITQHIQATFGITPTTGGSFFDGYGDGTGKMWQAMRHLLVSCAVDTQTEDALVASAIATFASLRGWCDRASADATIDTLHHIESKSECMKT